MPSAGIFEDWQVGSSTIEWTSTLPANADAPVTVFTRRCGTPGKPALVVVHGFPTSSVDFYSLCAELGSEFDIYLLDFPGFGLSDKPQAPWVYSLYDDARLLVHAITAVWGLDDYVLLAHDRGSSIAMIAVNALADGDHRQPRELILTNANIFLPLANLTAFQTALLDDATGRDVAAATTPDLLAAGLGASAFMPRRTLDDPEIATLAQCFAHNDGIRVLPDTIRYLHERAADENDWLTALSALTVNTTLVWGVHDTIAPLRVATHVWQSFVKDKPGRNSYWILPTADHYPQCDAPKQLADVVRVTVAGGDVAIQTLGNTPDGAVLVDRSRG